MTKINVNPIPLTVSSVANNLANQPKDSRMTSPTGQGIEKTNPTPTPSGVPPQILPSNTKLLPPSVVKDIEQKNIARRLAGLSPLVIRIRRCIACGLAFESAGNRTCGCSSRTAGTIAGREII